MHWLEYLGGYVELARKLNCPNLVFGSPKSRKVYGQNREELDRIYRIFLKEIDTLCDQVAFNIEPLSNNYCDYLHSYKEAVYVLKGQNYKNIKIQLDIRSILETNEDIDEIMQQFEYVHHVHTGNPGMDIPGGKWRKKHLEIAKHLHKINYSGYVTAEILNSQGVDPHIFLARTTNSMRDIYG